MLMRNPSLDLWPLSNQHKNVGSSSDEIRLSAHKTIWQSKIAEAKREREPKVNTMREYKKIIKFIKSIWINEINCEIKNQTLEKPNDLMVGIEDICIELCVCTKTV